MPTIQLLVYGANRSEVTDSVNTIINQYDDDKYCYGPFRGKFESIMKPNPTWWWYDEKIQKVSDEFNMTLSTKGPAIELNISIKSRTAEMCRFVHDVAEAIPTQICSDNCDAHVHIYTSTTCGVHYDFKTINGTLLETNL